MILFFCMCRCMVPAFCEDARGAWETAASGTLHHAGCGASGRPCGASAGDPVRHHDVVGGSGGQGSRAGCLVAAAGPPQVDKYQNAGRAGGKLNSKQIRNSAVVGRIGLAAGCSGRPTQLLPTGLNRHWDGVGVLVMARRKPGARARLPPQPSAFMKVAAGSTWTCIKMGDAQGMLPSTYQLREWTACACS